MDISISKKKEYKAKAENLYNGIIHCMYCFIDQKYLGVTAGIRFLLNQSNLRKASCDPPLYVKD